jgi:L,D-transpeptidase YcbB
MAFLVTAVIVACGPGTDPADEPEGPDQTVEVVVPDPLLDEIDDDLSVEPEIRGRLEAADAGSPLTAGGQPIRSGATLPAVYRERAFEALWLEGGRLQPYGHELLEALRTAETDGLRPQDYHLAALDSLVPRMADGSEEDQLRKRADVDLLLTDAFLLFGSHLTHGRLDPVSAEPAWTASRNGVDMGGILLTSLRPGAVAAGLASLRPAGDRYGVLRQTLAEYRTIADNGGWGSVPGGPTLDPGMEDARVEALRARLAASGDLPPDVASASDPAFYDDGLAEAVRAFQRRHGLDPDARVGTGTLQALNVSAADRAEQLVVNLERWRWLPRDMGNRYILVNIAGFSVHVVDDGEEVMRLRAIVGTNYRRTPVFSARMTYLALAPYWNVPPGIAANDQLPRIRQDPGYVAQQSMVLFENATNLRVDPHSVEWAGMPGAEFNRRFRLRQEPGPSNALGNVKFMFPNRHNVYLHDTPAQELFGRAARDFSSGCIRVEQAMELAQFLLQADTTWTGERLRNVVRQGTERSVILPEPVPVHIQYWTGWVEADGTVHFRPDLYDRDRRLREALQVAPPQVL